MPIKAEASENKISPSFNFPKLMQGVHTGKIALFTSAESGFVVDPKSTSYSVGERFERVFSETIELETDYRDYHGAVTLSNY